MKTNLIIGVVLAAVGLTLLIMGLNATDSMGERVTEGVTGHYTDKTTWFIIAGIAGLVAGGVMAAVSFRGTR